jgi:3-methyl-2-oxobutanoate hydroxymethyltransferase
MTVKNFKNLKNTRNIVMLTAYDSIFSSLFADEVDAILIGDSLNMSFNGKSDTLDITLDEMIYHAKAVKRGSKDTMLIFDLPFGTYTNKKQAFKSSKKAYQNCCIHAVKLEGGEEKAHIVKYLCDNNVAVMGHIGLLPQKVRQLGGYFIVGKTKESKNQLLKDALALEKAGAFAIIIEGVIRDTASFIAKNINIPLIGIGSGNGVDGQILVSTDMLGLYEKFIPTFSRKYVNMANIIRESVQAYKKDVLSSNFPNDKESF